MNNVVTPKAITGSRNATGVARSKQDVLDWCFLTARSQPRMMTSSDGNIFPLLALCAENSPVTGEFPHTGQWRGALMLPVICTWMNSWTNNREVGDLGRHRGHYDVTIMSAGEKFKYVYCFIYVLVVEDKYMIGSDLTWHFAVQINLWCLAKFNIHVFTAFISHIEMCRE